MIYLTPENKQTVLKSAEEFISQELSHTLGKKTSHQHLIQKTIFVNQDNLHGKYTITIKFEEI